MRGRFLSFTVEHRGRVKHDGRLALGLHSKAVPNGPSVRQDVRVLLPAGTLASCNLADSATRWRFGVGNDRPHESCSDPANAAEVHDGGLVQLQCLLHHATPFTERYRTQAKTTVNNSA